jgi:localization factor PodJL
MNSRVSWSVEGIEPTVRERAEAAARRAGVPLGDWLNSTIGDSSVTYSSPHQRPRGDVARDAARSPIPQREAQDVAEIHQRLDSITRQIDQISRPGHGEPGVARQLNDAISRLDARLSQITSAPAPLMQEPPRTPEMVERAAAQVYNNPPLHESPPLDPGLDFAVAEIAARMHELDDAASRIASPRARPSAPPPIQPAAPPPDMSGLERQLLKITTQIESMHRPEAIEASIAAFRSELAEIRGVITEAMPRRAIESIENEIRSLSRRIDDGRQSGIDGQALAGVERALGEIREALLTLTPAEQLAGFDDAINNLGGKIDLIVRTSGDPSTIGQLEGAIAALRAIVSNVASNEALGRLSDDLHTLSAKVDQLAQVEDYSESFAALEQRIATLTTTLESRDRPVATSSSDQLEGALRALSDRLDNLSLGNDGSSAIAHLEQRVSYLLERLEQSADSRSGHLGRVEDGLHDILRHLEKQQMAFGALVDRTSHAPSMDPALVDTIKRELSDMRFSQSETDRHTQDSLEVVHNTLGHVVDRLAMIEGDLRSVRAAPVAMPAPMPTARPQPPAPRATPAAPAVPRPDMPNPAQTSAQAVPPARSAPPLAAPKAASPHFDAAPREFAATQLSQEPAPSFVPKAISDILLDPRQTATTSRAAIAADLPPDFPLEPGTRPQNRSASPSERIAASQDAISELPGAHEPATASSFIAARRRPPPPRRRTSRRQRKKLPSTADRWPATRPAAA